MTLVVLPDAPFLPAGNGQVDPPGLDAETFWDARPELAHIRDFARARMASPWATLGVTLVRILAQVPPAYVLPPLVGTHASLNLYLAVVGPSGAGKDAAIGAASDAVNVGWINQWPIGTGEGVVKSYVHYEVDEDTGKGQIVQHETSAIFEASEIDKVAAISGRKGSTLMPLLRDAWTGKTLGFGNSENERRLRVEEQAYRIGLIVGVQPGRGRALLNDDEIAGGTPQRFVWLPATDPDAPDIEPSEPRALTWTMPDWPDDVWFGPARHALDVPAPIERTIRSARRARLRGDGAALDGHDLLCREKVAAALGLLNGHARITLDDWDLAGVVMTVSHETRAAVEQILRDEEALRSRAKRESAADEAVFIDGEKDRALLAKVCQRLTGKLDTDEWVNRSILYRSLRPAHRQIFDEAMDRLIDTGSVEAQPITGSRQAGMQYRRAGRRR